LPPPTTGIKVIVEQSSGGMSAIGDRASTGPHRVREDDVDGRRVRSLEAGRAGGEPVVLVPGLGAPGYLLDTLYGCSAGARAFLLDVPGFSHPPPWSCAPELSAVVRLVSAWLRTVCGQPVVLAGHSSGAQVALRVAATAPDSVARLVLTGPTFPPALRTLPAAGRALARTLTHESPGVVPTLLPYYWRAGPRALLRYIRSAQHDEPEQTIKSVDCPVTVLRGRHDALCPEDWAADLATAAPYGRLVTTPGAHTFPYSRGGLTAALITTPVHEASSSG
jgi:pimeloyl-ACP methyl ester carboxylesterase